jgi:hypothetical protein
MRRCAVTIRAKLYVAILLTVIGPVITIAVALHGMNRLGDRFDEVQDRSERRALALNLRYGVTDVNGWQTAYGYDNGASRGRFLTSVRLFRADLREASVELREPAEQRRLDTLRSDFAQFLRLDTVAFDALQEGDDARVKRIFLGPELELFDDMAATAQGLARYEARRAAATERAFDDSHEDTRRGLIAVALGALLVILLLLVTASDIARVALERERVRE